MSDSIAMESLLGLLDEELFELSKQGYVLTLGNLFGEEDYSVALDLPTGSLNFENCHSRMVVPRMQNEGSSLRDKEVLARYIRLLGLHKKSMEIKEGAESSGWVSILDNVILHLRRRYDLLSAGYSLNSGIVETSLLEFGPVHVEVYIGQAQVFRWACLVDVVNQKFTERVLRQTKPVQAEHLADLVALESELLSAYAEAGFESYLPLADSWRRLAESLYQMSESPP